MKVKLDCKMGLLGCRMEMLDCSLVKLVNNQGYQENSLDCVENIQDSVV